jgi:hypothetical protein
MRCFFMVGRDGGSCSSADALKEEEEEEERI